MSKNFARRGVLFIAADEHQRLSDLCYASKKRSDHEPMLTTRDENTIKPQRRKGRKGLIFKGAWHGFA
jgi:hypothetical protein